MPSLTFESEGIPIHGNGAVSESRPPVCFAAFFASFAVKILTAKEAKGSPVRKDPSDQLKLHRYPIPEAQETQDEP